MNIFYAAIDYWYLFWYQALSIFDRKVPMHWTDQDTSKGTILLIGGVYETWRFLKHIGDELHADGYAVYVIDALKRNTLPLDVEAGIVNTFIKDVGLENVTIIGHSKGGIIGWRALIDQSTPKITKVIAVASPVSGTNGAHVLRTKALKEMKPNSPAILELQKDTKHRELIYSVYPSYDNHVWHENGSHLEGANNTQLAVKGHHKILASGKLLKEIKRILET